MDIIDNLISDLEKLKDKGVRSFKVPMVGENDFNIDELLIILKNKINND